MTPTTAQKRGARYRYYISSSLQHLANAKADAPRRIPAPDIEAIVLNILRTRWRDRQQATKLGTLDSTPPDDRELIHQLVDRVVVGDGTVEVVLTRQGDNDPHDTSDVPGDEPGHSIVLPFVLKNRSPLRELISPTEDAPCLMRVDTRKTLLIAIAKARAWAGDLISGRVTDTNEIALREKRSERHIRMMLPLAFLAPDIVAAAVARSLPSDLGVSRLTAELPMSWDEQRERFSLVQANSLAS